MMLISETTIFLYTRRKNMRNIRTKRTIALAVAIAMLVSPGMGTIDNIVSPIQAVVSAAETDWSPVLDTYNLTVNVGEKITIRLLNATNTNWGWYISKYYVPDRTFYQIDEMIVKAHPDEEKFDPSLLEGAIKRSDGSLSPVIVFKGTVAKPGKFELEVYPKDDESKKVVCNITAVQQAETVTVDKEEMMVTAGESFSLTAKVSPDNTTDPTVNWSSSDTSVATVDDKGKVKTLKAGTATITAKCGKVKDTCEIFVGEKDEDATVEDTTTETTKTTVATTVNTTAPVLDKTEINVKVGDTFVIRDLNPDSYGSSYYVSTYYTDKVGDVYCANKNDVKNGKYDASLLEGAAGDSVYVYTYKVKNPGKFTFELTHKKTGEKAVCNIVAAEADSSSSETAASATETTTSKVEETTNNTATPSATESTTKTETTKIIPCKTIVWEKTGTQTIVVSGTAARIGGTKDFSELIVEVVPANTTDTITFSSSNPKVAAVDKDTGIVTYTGSGTADIIATATSGVSSKIHLVIAAEENHCEEVRFAGDTYRGTDKKIGSTKDYNFCVETRPVKNKIVDTFKFSSSDPSIVSITEDGIATYHKAGKATLYVETSNGKKASTTIIIEPTGDNRPCVDIKFNTDFYAYALSEKTAKASLIMYASPRNTTSKITYKSSNTSVVDVDKDTGLMTLKKAGTAVITISTDNGLSATTTVRVVDDNGYSSETAASTTTGTSTTSSSTGTSTTSSAGAAAQTKVTNLYLSPSSATIDINTTKTISPKIFPVTLANEPVAWTSSNTSVATVNNGIVKAVGKGTADIIAVCGGKTATCKVTVNVPLQRLNITSSISQDVGTTGSINYGIYPANATNQTITWTSAKPEIASVDASGKVTFKKKGSTTITATCDGITATCAVTVTPIKATSINFPDGVYEIPAGTYTSIDWSKYVTPSNADMTDEVNKVTWTTTDTNKVFYDVKSGRIYTSHYNGTATLKATLPNGASDTWTIKVVSSGSDCKFTEKERTFKVDFSTDADVGIYLEHTGSGLITANEGSIEGKSFYECFKESQSNKSVRITDTRVVFSKAGDYTFYIWPVKDYGSDDNLILELASGKNLDRVASAPTDSCVVHVVEYSSTIASWINSASYREKVAKDIAYTEAHPEKVEAERKRLYNELIEFRKGYGVTDPVTLISDSSVKELAQTRSHEAVRLLSHNYTYDDNGNKIAATPKKGYGECMCTGGSIYLFGNSLAHTEGLLSSKMVTFGIILSENGNAYSLVVLDK